MQLIRSERVESDPGEVVLGLVLADEFGQEIHAYLRRPASTTAPLPATILVAGRYAGREAAMLIPSPLTSVVLALEYPADLPDRMRLHRAIRDLPRIRQTARRMPALLVGAAVFAAELPEVDASRIGLVGISFGVPFAAVAGSDPIFGAVVLAYGGAGLSEMLAENLPIEPGVVRGAAAKLAGWYFEDLEPERHVAEIAPTPLLLVNGIYDSLIPHASAIRLATAAEPPVRHVWLPTEHIGEARAGVIRDLALTATAFLDEVWTREHHPPRRTIVVRTQHGGRGSQPDGR